MKLTYIANARFPTEKAHGIQIAKMCEAFKKKGADVELIVPFRLQNNKELRKASWKRFYGIKNDFRVTKLPAIDLLWLDKFLPQFLHYPVFILMKFSFLISLTFYLSVIKEKEEIIITREAVIAPLGKLLNISTFIEIHDFPRTNIGVKILVYLSRYAKGIILTNKHFIDKLSKLGINRGKILLAENATDDHFLAKRNKSKSRELLNLPLKKTIVAYIGSISKDKGIYTLLKAARILRQNREIMFLIVGKALTDAEQTELEKNFNKLQLPNTKYVGHQHHSKIPLYLSTADILIIPFSGKRKALYTDYLSPLKVYEYMASRRPIISSDIPGLKAIFEKNNSAVFFKNDNPQDLATKINILLRDNKLAQQYSKKAYALVKGKTWKTRAEKIVEFINKIIN